LRKNLYGNTNFRLRREAIADIAKVFPLQKNGAIYGAVPSGEHYFYISDSAQTGRSRRNGNFLPPLAPESESVFFTIDRDLTFEFVKEGTKVSKVVVREHAAIVEEAKTE